MEDSLIQRLYEATDNGLNIILSYYPQAAGCDRPGKFFKIRPDEKTASASMKQIKGVWRVTDFGDGGQATSPIEICMREERLDFREALFTLLERYGVNQTISAAVNKADISSRDARDDEKEGDFNFEMNDVMSEGELKVLGPMVTQQTVDRYHYYSLKWYSTVKNRKVTTVASNENYPIFMRDCGDFKKIYQPLNPDKAFRFFYKGVKPKDFLNGLAELKEAHLKHQREMDEEENKYFEDGKAPEEGKKRTSDKLPEAVLCSGERDALNVAGMGYYPLWMNSETAHLDKGTYNEVMKRVERLYNIPDMDETGVKKGFELALEYTDIYTVELPEWLSTFRDNRGRPRKDLRDFVEIKPSVFEFKQLMNMAKPCRFWEKIPAKSGFRYEINTLFLLHFLKANGFCKISDVDNDRATYIHIDGYRVKETNTTEITDFVVNWAKQNKVDLDIQNLILNSSRVGETSYQKIDSANLNFNSYTQDSQTLFFNNVSVTVFADRIEEHKNGKSGVYAWDKSISRHDFKRLAPSFEVKYNEATNTSTLYINNTDSHYFRFLINASRIYWREEFEHRVSGIESVDDDWQRKFHWSIGSDRLTAEEIQEQSDHLLNKMYVIGYLLHSYKSFARALGVWVLENKITEEEESSGGSGKTFMLRFLKYFKNMEMVNGRDKKLTDNQFFMDRVTENTDLLLIDDAQEYFNFNYFYSMITDNMVVNYKNAKSKEIDFKDAPKIVITSNFAPRANDGSTARRILNCVFSDYYHKATDDNDYTQSMRIADDFGYELYDGMYKWEWWNQDYNFCVDCLQFYLQMNKHNKVVYPPMDKITKRMKLQLIGDTFKEWADVYFSPGSENMDRLISKSELKDLFDPKKMYSPHTFTKKLKAYCDVAEHIDQMNPECIHGYRDGRILRKQDGETKEFVYVKSHNKGVDATLCNG